MKIEDETGIGGLAAILHRVRCERIHTRCCVGFGAARHVWKRSDFMTTFKIACIVFAIVTSLATATRADDLLIWSPAKLSDRSYKATMGFRLPAEWETSAGADIGLASTKGGAPLPDSGQAMLWGRIDRTSVTPAGQSQRGASINVDTLRGSGALTLSRSRSWILSDTLDMQSSRSISVQYDAVDIKQASVTASQALKLIHPWTGTSLSAGAGVSNASGDFSSTVAVNQAILPNLNLDASVNNPFSASEAGSVNLRYRLNW
ncbi:hypothetical protein HJB86_10565 [Rhizobium sp. NZLR3b]|nr:hypothetical protein [Rhizobium sp. NZLR3b]